MQKNIRWTEEGNLGVIDSIKISLESLVTSTLERTDRSRRIGNSFSRSRRENDLRAAVSLTMDCRRTVSERSSDFACFEIFLHSFPSQSSFLTAYPQKFCYSSKFHARSVTLCNFSFIPTT